MNVWDISGINKALTELSSAIRILCPNVNTQIHSAALGVLSAIRERQQWYEEVKKLDYDEFNDYYSERFAFAEKIGKYGWVISPETVCNDDVQALHKLEKGAHEKSVLSTFIMSKAVEENMLSSLEEHYKDSANLNLYYQCFLKKMKSRDYMSAAMYISAVFDYCFRQFCSGQYRRVQAMCKNALPEKREQLFNAAKKANRIGVLIIVNDYMVSFNAFAERLLTVNKNLDWDNPKNEPEYLNRDWLMHGKITRKIERYELLQVVNALITLKALEEEFQQLDELGIGSKQ